MSSELSSRSKRIIQSSLRDILGANDFRKLGRKYFRSVGDINWLVIAPGDRWASSSITTLTIEVGIHVPGVIAVWTNAREPLNPGIEDCCISAHIEHLASQPKSGVWDLRTTDDAPARDAEVIADLRKRLNDDALPFLRRFQAVVDVIDFLEEHVSNPRHGILPLENLARIYLGILWHQHGNNSKCAEYLEQALRRSEIQFNRDRIALLQESLCP